MKIKLLKLCNVKKAGKTIGKNKMENFNKKLEELKGNNSNPFRVPEGYFDSFPTKIQERITSENKQYNWALKFFNYIKPQFALAFMIIAFGFIAYTSVNYILKTRVENSVINEYSRLIIEVDPSEFSEQHVIDFMFDDEKKINEKKQEKLDLYIKYLVDEDIDYTTLIDEL